MTHAERTIRIARVAKKYNLYQKRLIVPGRKARDFGELENFLAEQCAKEGLQLRGMKNIVGFNDWKGRRGPGVDYSL